MLCFKPHNYKKIWNFHIYLCCKSIRFKPDQIHGRKDTSGWEERQTMSSLVKTQGDVGSIFCSIKDMHNGVGFHSLITEKYKSFKSNLFFFWLFSHYQPMFYSENPPGLILNFLEISSISTFFFLIFMSFCLFFWRFYQFTFPSFCWNFSIVTHIFLL